ncbi:N-acetylglucosamine-6-phosphate deacetylase [Frondihabitans sucicola]|uniref:N-acetylglucosamine-6-phosphate deacetylase n=1 Tax=Frondihabitans sucicola TaxID=1268041 RepID=A0ABN6XW05_9MICO|nr:N-acetylglucosamine-6-phosphate deacetylase [Frondihabitans sucicola]BDZ49199.1 N-acetylglucosamine-6-phosphate deacetylase [Frondihabitans sucicola]
MTPTRAPGAIPESRRTTLLTNLTRLDADGEAAESWILLDGDRIRAVDRHAAGPLPVADETVDLGGATITPGFVDLHAHGGGGFAFDDGVDAIRRGLAPHRERGTTRSVISLVANPPAALHASLAAIADLAATDPLVLGAHLEGPFLSPDNRGAHHPHFLAAPDPALVDDLLEASRGALRQITIAPELRGALDAIERLAAAGVRVALGHTTADYEQTRAGFDRGATLLTHAFNAMPGIHHRAPGPIVAAIDDARVTLEVILDGVHVHPSVARLLFDAAPGRVALVTDAMAAAGAADGPYRLGSLDVTVSHGTALLAGTTTIAGSTLTQDAALRLAITAAGLSARDAVAALTRTPARALGLDSWLGLIAPGYAADVVVWNDDWTVRRVWAAGRPVAVGAAARPADSAAAPN